MSESMKIEKLKNYGIPSYAVNIWEKHYSNHLFPLQEDAVRNYGVLDSRFRGNDIRGNVNDRGGNGNDRGGNGNDKRRSGNDPSEARLHGANIKDCVNDSNKNLLVIAPPSLGKTFIGEMAAIAKVINLQKPSI